MPKELLKGNNAIAEAAIRAGVEAYFGYPITPQTELLEHMAARTPWANPESTWRIYSALATAAGVARPVRVDDPRVLVGLLQGGATDTVLFVNCSPDTIVADPILEEGRELAEGPPTLDPFEVAVIACDRSSIDRGTPIQLETTSVVSRGERRDARA